MTYNIHTGWEISKCKEMACCIYARRLSIYFEDSWKNPTWGMSDLCSPMIILLEDEADAFWCFEHLMRRLRGNSRGTESSVGEETQLSDLASITQVLDPKLHQHLATEESH